MKYICPTCGKAYDVNYCDECKKIIELPDNNSGKNTIQVWGIVVTVLGCLGVLYGVPMMFQNNLSGIYWFSAGIAFALFGLLLLGISAIVDRLNTIIKLMKEKKTD